MQYDNRKKNIICLYIAVMNICASLKNNTMHVSLTQINCYIGELLAI